MKWKTQFGISTTLVLAAASVLAGVAPAQAAPSQLVPGSVQSAAIGGAIDYTVYLPNGYDASGATRYPTLYLLHGRGDSQAAWQQEAGALDELIAAGEIPPMIVVMPDAPWSDRGNYYVDSLYTGAPATAAVETGFTVDLVDHIDASFPTVDDRAARAVGGYSMGGAGALRFATVHQDTFSAGIVLSPAVYFPSTPVDSSTREFGAYGVGAALYDESRYQQLSYPTAFADFDPALPVHLFIAVGDDEWANPLPQDAIHDLDYEAATLYNKAKRVPGISAEMRVYNGGHDWGVWDAGFREGLRDLAGYLQTTPPAPFEGSQFGSPGDDRAGGVLGRSDGSVVQVVNAAGPMLGQPALGGFDILVQSLDAAGAQRWVTPVATALNERAYGIADGTGGASIVGGYVRQDHAGASQNDDALAVKLAADGTVQWRTTFGAQAAADRVYGIAADGAGGAFVTGYTSGAIAGGTSAGDKDAVVAHVDASGTVLWATQFGSSGEDKGFAVAAAPNGGVYVGGTAGAAMPGATGAGGYDGWVARFDAAGAREWITTVGSSETDQVSSLVATATGVAATGFTGGVVGEASAGSTDVFATALAADGTVQWTTQDGSSGDDRGAAIAADASGRLLIVGHTSGSIAASSGGVDIFTMTLEATGAVVERAQFGSAARDGADDFDEANIYASGGGSTWIQALSYGQVDGATNVGGGDVVLVKVGFDAVVAGVGAVPGGVSDAGPYSRPAFVGVLGATGADITRAFAVAALLVLLGSGLLAARRLRRVRHPAGVTGWTHD
ncbi:enterochelin esterase-like enzyme [Conyzicola nivalis]|uniref:Enterochelin esterase-like enzyme n=1 Tax=Conyzicola nivalis TaxID=1477021 RepID=A0ABV2QMQ3_9MICO